MNIKLLVILILLTSCSKERQNYTRSELKIAIKRAPLSLDPHSRNEIITLALLANINDPLFVLDNDFGIHPRIAEKWENTDDLTWKIYIKRHLHFSNNSPIRAQDVVATIRRSLQEKSAIKSYLLTVKEIKAISNWIVEIKTYTPDPLLLYKLAYIYIIPHEYLESPYDGKISSGLYRVQKWFGKENNIILVKNSYHFLANEQYPDVLEFIIESNEKKRISMVTTGKADIAEDITPYEASLSVKQHRNVEIVPLQGLIIRYLHLKPSSIYFKDPQVRKAIALAIDRERMVKELFKGYARAAYAMIPKYIFGYTDEINLPKRNLQKAKELLSKANYPSEPITLYTSTTDKTPEYIASDLKEIGITVNIKRLNFSELYPKLQKKEIEFYYGGVITLVGDSIGFLETFVHSKGAANFVNLEDEELDKIIEDASRTLDMALRKQKLSLALKVLKDKFIFIPIINPDSIYIKRRDIQWKPNFILPLFISAQ